jgi:hypothetical protein
MLPRNRRWHLHSVTAAVAESAAARQLYYFNYELFYLRSMKKFAFLKLCQAATAWKELQGTLAACSTY